MNTEHSICNMHQLSPIFTQVGAHSPNNEDIDIDIKWIWTNQKCKWINCRPYLLGLIQFKHGHNIKPNQNRYGLKNLHLFQIWKHVSPPVDMRQIICACAVCMFSCCKTDLCSPSNEDMSLILKVGSFRK